jgi:hypothetical protein
MIKMAKKELPKPVTTEEKFAAKAAGIDVETPTPVTNMEKYLDAIAKGGGGGGDSYTKDETDALLAPYSGIEETGNDYIELKSGVRLYITDTTPTGTIPTGSVGIGF